MVLTVGVNTVHKRHDSAALVYEKLYEQKLE